MILQALEKGEFHEGMTKGVIGLIPKDGDLLDLDHWRPITLLTMMYKIFAKAMQMRLQPQLMEVISLDQSAFIPFRYILNNIMLTHETMHWANHSKQPTVFLKLDFSKAYDKVSWDFLFKAMEKIGVDRTFIKWTRMLFKNARLQWG